MLILILDGKTAVSGASEGLEVCIRTVIPSMFPFFLLSGIMTSAFMGSKMPIKIFIVPQGAESLLITGFLGGYPVGAQSIAYAYRRGQLSKNQAERMLAFCNNAGPSFLFGMISSMFPSVKFAWYLWLIHMISAVLTAFLLPKEVSSAALMPGKATTLSDALLQAIQTMASVCGWIILFRIVISFLDRWLFSMLDNTWKVTLTGLLELSNGCIALPIIENVEHRFLICSIILALGGLCVTMQTMSATQGLSLRYYFPGKCMQAAWSILLCWIILKKDSFSLTLPFLSVIVLAISVVFLRKKQNYSSIPKPVGV